jgi:hypothetical protein
MKTYRVALEDGVGTRPAFSIKIKVDEDAAGGFYATNLDVFGCGKTRPTPGSAIKYLVGDHGYRVLAFVELK